MKNDRNYPVLIAMGCIIGMLLIAGCAPSTVATYTGDTRTLEQVAVLVTSPDSCPVFSIDGEYRDLQRKTGAEFHLLPGNHAVEVFYQTRGANNSFNIERQALKYDFKAGHVYTVQKTAQPVGPQTLASTVWSPTVQDLGDVVNYAMNNPEYATNKQWKQLRKDNGLNRSLMDYFKKDKAELATESDVIIK